MPLAPRQPVSLRARLRSLRSPVSLRARLQPCRNPAKTRAALAAEVSLWLLLPTLRFRRKTGRPIEPGGLPFHAVKGWVIACGSKREAFASRYPEASASGLYARQTRKGPLGPGVCLRLSAILITLLLTGCHHKPPHVSQQPPPPVRYPEPARPTRPATPPPGLDDITGPPVYTEVGLASWYGPSFNRRAAADGSVYNQDGLTAAHRTLPMGSTVRVTNLATGQQVYVRITDRGPFVRGRILDLSMGAAKAIGLYRAGVGRVRIEAFRHVSADPPGRWCVQTGPFIKERDATDLKEALLKRYRGARIAEFAGPTGFWVRIDPADHARTDALEIQDWIGDPDPSAVPYLVRID